MHYPLFLYHGGMAEGTQALSIPHSDFPSLKREQVYLDTAATSLTPEPVLRSMEEYYREYRASTHRGLYASAERATEAYEKARADVALFISHPVQNNRRSTTLRPFRCATADEIVFTSGATSASNMLIYMLEHSLDLVAGDEIVTTVMEHHASLIPLQELAKRKGLVLKHIPLDGICFDYKNAETLITERTKVVSVLLASNVLGTVNDVARIAKKAHAVGAVMVVDGTAAVGHMPVNVRELDCDFLYFSGHKMCGPTGIGVLYGKRAMLETLKPGMYGGGIVDAVTLETARYTDIPQRFEPGTPNIAGVIGLGAAVEYLSTIGVDHIREHARELTSYAQKTLGALHGVTMHSAPPEHNIGIVSFTLEGVHPHDIAQVCADRGVAIRAGHHCAMPLHAELGVSATARASFYLYNIKDDVDALALSVSAALNVFRT